jgi:hypothetical protein
MNKVAPRIIVVLGMHRSGTSAITRALQAIGVGLGQSLMPPISDNNEKGFFEDIEINELNIEILKSLDSDWDALSIIPESALIHERLVQYKLRAVELIQAKVGEKPFGIKDPRMSRLLPFWCEVFNQVGASVSFVIALRNPKSVVESLKKRDGFDVEKSYYLWLEHVVPAMLHTQKFSRVAVSYDLLMTDTRVQLERVAQCLDLPFDINSSDVKIFINDFLDKKLRHTIFDKEDLKVDPAVPAEVIRAYDLLVDITNDVVDISEPNVAVMFNELDADLQRMTPALSYMDRGGRKITAIQDALVVELKSQLNSVNENANAQIAYRDALVNDLQSQLSSVNENATAQIAYREALVVELQSQLSSVNENANAQIAYRDALVVDLQSRLSSVNENANAQIAYRDEMIIELNQKIEAAQSVLGSRSAMIKHIFSKGQLGQESL